MEKKLSLLFLCAFVFFGHHISIAQNVIQDSIYTTTSITASLRPINNIVVTNSGNLRITSMSCITIEKSFEVMLGGTLIIDNQEPANIIFTYDNSGNRTTRKLDE